jgi:hypothetical protein
VANIKLAFGSVQTMVTTNLQSLASSTTTGAWQSASVDNSANLYLDALVIVTLVGPATVSADRAAYVYAYGSIDGGTTYPDAISGSEGALTFNSDPPNLRSIGSISMPVNSGTFKSEPMSIAAAFGGILPGRWGVAIRNASGGALAASGNVVKYQEVYATTA